MSHSNCIHSTTGNRTKDTASGSTRTRHFLGCLWMDLSPKTHTHTYTHIFPRIEKWGWFLGVVRYKNRILRFFTLTIYLRLLFSDSQTDWTNHIENAPMSQHFHGNDMSVFAFDWNVEFTIYDNEIKKKWWRRYLLKYEFSYCYTQHIIDYLKK